MDPKFSPSGWSLVRKNDDLAVMYEDCPCISTRNNFTQKFFHKFTKIRFSGWNRRCPRTPYFLIQEINHKKTDLGS